MDKLSAFTTIAAEAARGELAFPTNVNASLKIQQALNDPECHTETAVKLVMAEPVLAARTVALANSVAYHPVGPEITNVRHAVVRLGFKTLRSLVASMVVRQLGSATPDPALRSISARLWEHTAHVAALSYAIAKRATRIDPDTAMFAGIVHEVGGFYLLSQAAKYPGLVEDGDQTWAEQGEKLIGRSVLKQLEVPEAVSTGIEALWYGMRALPPETLGDVLLLANDLAPVPSPLHRYSPDAITKDSATTLDFAVGNGTLNTILEESAGEVASLTAALLA